MDHPDSPEDASKSAPGTNESQSGSSHKHETQEPLRKLIKQLAEDALRDFTGWAPALRAAPNAISAMATCLVASTAEAAGAIEINPIGVVPGVGKIEFPHKHLSTNLQHCSDLGRIAFSEAQNSMHRLQGYTQYMTGTDGLISNILEMLKDNEAARYNLRTAMEHLRENADRCKKETESIQRRFKMLLDFIMALQNAALEKLNDAKVQQTINTKRVSVCESKKESTQKAYTTAIESCKEEVNRLKDEYSSAQDGLQKAKRVLDELPLGPSLDAAAADSKTFFTEPDVKLEAPNMSDGLLQYFKHAVVGKSSSRKAEEARALKEAQQEYERQLQAVNDQRQKKIDGLLKQRQNELNVAKEEAQKRIETAQSTFEAVKKQLEAAKTKLKETENNPLKEKLDLDASRASLEALKNEKIELKDILIIIKSSIKSLMETKGRIDDMCQFFHGVSIEVHNAVDDPMATFLSGIDTSAPASGNQKYSQRIEKLEVNEISKNQLYQTALHLQGKLSIISDVAGVYVIISKSYIKPGINKMEALAYLEPSEYATEQAEFIRWCVKSVKEIETFSCEQGKVMIDRMKNGVWDMARKRPAIQN
ncbi:hypothetical protein TWF718_002487 [Orbilia javanica]|uniref:Uncharacterized protein n=1 Tax=Orbilia javanica TaxID=47235 RepID=A0AAN8RCF5_9PEZI